MEVLLVVVRLVMIEFAEEVFCMLPPVMVRPEEEYSPPGPA